MQATHALEITAEDDLEVLYGLPEKSSLQEMCYLNQAYHHPRGSTQSRARETDNSLQ